MTTVINKNGAAIDFEAAVELMEDGLREEVHGSTEQEFFTAYEEAHEAKYGEEWELSKGNPVW